MENMNLEVYEDNNKDDNTHQLLEYFNRDTKYWNHYYKENKAPREESLFARWVMEQYIQKRKGMLLELGCGNGRDSIFFADHGLNVMAIDASDVSVRQLCDIYIENNLKFFCDDFVKATKEYNNQFEYIYSRFSLHAINEKQETELINNVYNSLKQGGIFFIEVRSVNDEFYGKGMKVGVDEYIFEGHYRRFIRKEKLETSLKKKGFVIEYSREKRDFAPYGESNPPVIRIVAVKK